MQFDLILNQIGQIYRTHLGFQNYFHVKIYAIPMLAISFVAGCSRNLQILLASFLTKIALLIFTSLGYEH